MIILTSISVSATFYKTVILQDFEVTGVWIEFPTPNSSYVWFVYDNQEYELDLDTTDYLEIETNVANELEVDISNLDPDFIDYLQSAYDEAEVTGESIIK